MPSPTPSDRYIKPLLTNVAVKWLQENRNFIANQVFPNLPVRLQGGHIAQYSIADLYRNPGISARRGLSEESKGIKYRVDKQEYFCFPYALHKDIDVQERVNQMRPFDADRDATEIVTQQLMILREVEFAQAFFRPGVWGIDMEGVSSSPSSGKFLQWDQDGSDPVQDVAKIRVEIGKTGFVPNVLAVDFKTHEALKNNKCIKERIKYGASPSNPAIVNEQTLAAIFEVEKYVVGKAVYTVSEDGDADEVTDYIMPPGALLAYAAPSPSIQRPSAGYTLSWTGLIGGGNEFGIRITQWWMQEIKSWRVEGEMAYAMKQVAPALGAFFSNTVSSN